MKKGIDRPLVQNVYGKEDVMVSESIDGKRGWGERLGNLLHRLLITGYPVEPGINVAT
jgi:hypothetical protein